MRLIENSSPTSTVPEILVVDDDHETLGELAALVSAAGYFCHKTTDPERAIGKVASDARIGIVVTDVQMPGQSGLAMLKRMQQVRGGETMPEAVVVTGVPDLDTAVGALRLDAVDFLKKPLGFDDLVAALEKAVHRWALRHGDTETAIDARLDRLTRELATLGSSLRSAEGGERGGAGRTVRRPVTAEAVKLLIRQRKDRERFFDSRLFSDPAWDMLLDLTAAGLAGREVPVSSLCVASGVPHATALRRIDELSDAGLVDRTPDPKDKRRVLVHLTGDAEKRMLTLLDELLNEPLVR